MRAAPRPAHSLRRRLLWLVLAAIAFASLLQASSAYRSALRQADEMFDEHLQQLAHSVQGGVPLPPDAGLFDFQLQIWGPDGTPIFASRGTTLPPRALLGFSDVSVEGVRYRVYSLQTARHTIQVAQDLDARQARARLIALRATLPVALLAPLLMISVGWMISRSFAPVERIRRQVAERPADDLSALPDAGLPDEVLPLVREINLLFERVRGALAAQRHFVADAAHELRSPLTALKLQARALGRTQDDAQREATISRLNDGIERAILLVNQLLVLARQESESLGAHKAELVDLQELARSAVADVLPLARARGIDVGLATSEAVQVRGRMDDLHILLRNLLDNAVKYAPEGGQVDISLAQEGGTGARLSVEDTGPGIAESERERVFDRFYRAAGHETNGVAGSGLGLAIVRAIAQRHGATVTLDRSERLGGLKAVVVFGPAD